MASNDRMPVVIQNWAEEMRNPQNTPAIRYNYYMQFKALHQFANKQIEEYEKSEASAAFRGKNGSSGKRDRS